MSPTVLPTSPSHRPSQSPSSGPSVMPIIPPSSKSSSSPSSYPTIPPSFQASDVLTPGSISSPGSICIDSLNNLYIADASTNVIYKVTAAGVKSTLSGVLEATPYGIAFTARGIFVSISNSTFGSVHLLNSTTGSLISQVTSYNWKAPRKIASDGNGRVFIADSGTNQIVVIRINDLTNPRNYTINVSGLMGVAVNNGASDIFYTESNPLGVYDLTNNNRLISSDFTTPNSVALDFMGNLYVTDYVRNAVYKISNSSSGILSPVSILSVNQPTGIVFLSSGALVVIAKNSGSGRVIIARSFVFYIIY